ncbi:MAG TPA: hypothetical protein GXZ59_06285 [Clostridiaceae bacterium]|nr:hypothetical protein [Clostridiaceae bacterium]
MGKPRLFKRKITTADVKKVIGFVLWLSLFVSMGYAIYRIIITPPDAVPPDTPRLQSDYILMLVSCVAGIIVMRLPNFLEKNLKIQITDSLSIIYYIFLYAGIFLGEVRDYFQVYAHWDTILHISSAGMLAALGFKLISTLNNWERLRLNLSPAFLAFFSFCFSATVGVLWEIYEFAADSLFGMNMQKFMLPNGALLSGQEALADTMWDFIVNVAGALIVSVYGFFTIRNRRKKEFEQPDSKKEKGSADQIT